MRPAIRAVVLVLLILPASGCAVPDGERCDYYRPGWLRAHFAGVAEPAREAAAMRSAGWNVSAELGGVTIGRAVADGFANGTLAPVKAPANGTDLEMVGNWRVHVDPFGENFTAKGPATAEAALANETATAVQALVPLIGSPTNVTRGGAETPCLKV